MTRIRKERAGSDSFGNTWPEDGAVVDVDPEQVASLLAIPDGGFSEVTPQTKQDEEPDDSGAQTPTEPGADEDPDPKTEVSEVNPDAPAAEPEAKTAPAKKTTARKAAASKVEE